MVISDDVPEAKLGANAVGTRPATNAQPLIGSCRDDSPVPDVIALDPVASLINQVGKFAVAIDDGGQRSGNVNSRDPAQPVGLLREVRNPERYLLAALQMDVLILGVFADFFAIDFLTVDFHDVESRPAIARTQFIDTGRFDPKVASNDVSSTNGIGCGFHTTERGQLQRLLRLHPVVVGVGVVLTGVDRDDRLQEFRTPSAASARDLTDADHVRLAGEDVDFDWLVRRKRSRNSAPQKQ